MIFCMFTGKAPTDIAKISHLRQLRWRLLYFLTFEPGTAGAKPHILHLRNQSDTLYKKALLKRKRT